MKGTENKLSMEKYLDFVVSSKQTDLKVTKDFLQQIIKMHGFKKMEGPKSVVIDALKTIDLMSPLRSTLKENISSAVSVTLNDVIKDLNDLSWQECCVTSIKTLNLSQNQEKHDTFSNLKQSTDIHQVSKSIGDASAASTSSYAGSEIDEKSKKCVKKRKRNVSGGENSSKA